ncbi:hypothetical protein SKAU_G00274290 [Synaphobranchus kaupii]|uniref:Uncharacterized protein n=1 Tax=Synaphobranchus kaupii TaxID=118154 RepID=A0A9Q1IQ00_SYNKA|nr:hypothetical protein SKAU_G00274290 [Synaphobranchus kaupii]
MRASLLEEWCSIPPDTQYRTVDRAIHAVKSLCSLLDEVETPAIAGAVKRVRHEASVPQLNIMSSSVLLYAAPRLSYDDLKSAQVNEVTPALEDALAQLTSALYELVKLYLRSFCPVTTQNAECEPGEGSDSREASGTTEHLRLTLFTVHGITNAWVSR